MIDSRQAGIEIVDEIEITPQMVEAGYLALFDRLGAIGSISDGDTSELRGLAHGVLVAALSEYMKEASR